MRRIAFMAAIALMAVSGAHAEGYLTPYGTGTSVLKYHVHAGGGLTLWVSGINNPDACGDASLVFIPPTLASYKTSVAAVMAAFAAGNKVGLYSSGCSTIPFWGGATTHPDVSDLWITN